MNHATSVSLEQPVNGQQPTRLESLQQDIEHAAHLLPSQGPIRVFVHHNTLHAFEEMPFDEAVSQGGTLYGCNPYLPEERYREKVDTGRILQKDLAAVLLEELREEADRLIGFLGTRFHLRLAMLQHPLRCGPDAELKWLIAETDALRRFRPETPHDVRTQMIEETRRWVMRDLRMESSWTSDSVREAMSSLFERFGGSSIEKWSSATWEEATLNLLWSTCMQGVRGVDTPPPAATLPVRHRDMLLQATGRDSDRLVNEVLIRFCAAFLDQGIAHWMLPTREQGFFRSFSALYRDSRPVERWLRGLPAELQRIEQRGLQPLEVVEESLKMLGVAAERREAFLTQTMLALRGWTGMLWQMETNAEWTVHPAPAGTLVEYVAVRLLLERLALSYTAREALGRKQEPSELPAVLENRLGNGASASKLQRTFLVFQLAQTRGWKPGDLQRMSAHDWSQLLEEIESFSSFERRRIYHLAFERRYRNQTLDAYLAHEKQADPTPEKPTFQVICCIDEREESFRRHLEEIAPDCETLGVAGFYGVAMYYRGAADAHYVPLCPVVVKPQHYVQEEVVYSFEEAHRRRAETRRAIGRTRHWLHTGSRSVVGGAATALLGTLASFPLVMSVLFPRLTSRLRRMFSSFVRTPPITRLLIERQEALPGPEKGHLGYSVAEMVDIGERMLRDMGLTRRFARLVVVTGHGSSSLNNPHESAHDCGACGGGRGGPNARALAWMLNDLRVRERLAKRDLIIPGDTVFVGAYHNTCDDNVEYFDLDCLPSSHHEDFERARDAIETARRRDAHERCRRFESAELSLTSEGSLRHVQGRAEDISQVRPEYGHATNAICYVGRRERTRGLFLDRRSFLMSYDPQQDDAACGILERILQAVIPVCAGINLEYYFSFVDPTGYGCGTKLPHNITSLLGVMDGAASDLRPGLPWQMVEIHEPVRILFIIEATPEAMLGILDRNPALARLVFNQWVQLAVLDPDSTRMQVLQHGRFKPYVPESTELPLVGSSVDWYRGWRDHLGYASVAPKAAVGASAPKLFKEAMA